METALDPRSSSTVVLQSTFMALIILAAIVGNSLILASLYRFTSLQTKTNAFVLNLAIADLFLAVFAMPFTLISSIKYNWIFGNVMCQITGALNSIFCAASIMTLAFVSLERFFAIAYPLKYEILVTPRRVKIVIGYIWFQAILGAGSTFLFSKFTYLRFESICTVDWGRNMAYTLIFALVFFLIPFLVTAVLYCIILNKARKQRRKIEVIKVGEIVQEFCKMPTRRGNHNDKTGERRTTKEHKATVMIAIVIGTFGFCWFPHAIGIFCILDPNCRWNDSFYVATTWMAMLNSALNSLIYGLMNRSFRRAFKSIFMCNSFIGDSEILTNFRKDTKDKKNYGNASPID